MHLTNLDTPWMFNGFPGGKCVGTDQFIKEESRYCDRDTRFIGKFIIPIAHPNIMTISPYT